MAKSATKISSDIKDLLRSKGNNEVIMLRWEDFYTICDRERLADVVLENIKKALKENDIHIIYGSNVIIVRDFGWKIIEL